MKNCKAYRWAAVLLLLSAVFLQAALPVCAKTAKKTANTAAKTAAKTAVKTEARASSDPVWDIILFWGQSNMLGCAAGTQSPFSAYADDLASLSAASGIDVDILEATESARLANIPVPEKSVYEYDLLTDSLEELCTGDLTGITGTDENGLFAGITFDEETGTFAGNHEELADKPAAKASVSTNMIPAFCTAWKQLTGHNVIVLFAAVGGVGVQAFLPMNHADYLPPVADSTVQYSHIFEYIAASYQCAKNLAGRERLSLGGSYWVSCQGEGDIGNSQYETYYREVTDCLSALGFQTGALVETSSTIGEAAYYPYVEKMHNYQVALSTESADICLGSSLDYDRYLPDRTTYEKTETMQEKWGGISYRSAYRMASWYVDTLSWNRVHLNSAALSQMGRDAAKNLAAVVGTK